MVTVGVKSIPYYHQPAARKALRAFWLTMFELWQTAKWLSRFPTANPRLFAFNKKLGKDEIEIAEFGERESHF